MKTLLKLFRWYGQFALGNINPRAIDGDDSRKGITVFIDFMTHRPATHIALAAHQLYIDSNVITKMQFSSEYTFFAQQNRTNA